MRTIKFLFLFLLLSPFIFSQSIDGRWQGNITFLGNDLKIIARFETGKDSVSGFLDIPAQGAKDFPLAFVNVSGSSVKFVLPGPAPANFNGSFINKDSIYGDFVQAGITGNFNLSIYTGIQEEIKKEEPKPYKEEEVNFMNGDISFAGTLSLPQIEGKHPAVILITGSGAQTRDEEIVGFKIFGVIADHLTRNGIAVLRYDDRKTGKSTGPSVNESTSEDFAADVTEAVKYLRSRNDIDASKIGLLGHSEGGVVAPMVAAKDNTLAFIILMAGTGVNGMEIIKEQTKLIMLADSASMDDVDAQMKVYDAINNAIRGSEEWSSAEALLRKQAESDFEKLTEEQKKSIKDKNEFINSSVNMQIGIFKGRWMTFFLSHEPASVLKQVKIPVLAIFGGKDLQVSSNQNAQHVREALTEAGNKNFKIVIIPEANHLFQCSDTGGPSEYAKLPKEFCGSFLNEITGFINEVVNK